MAFRIKQERIAPELENARSKLDDALQFIVEKTDESPTTSDEEYHKGLNDISVKISYSYFSTNADYEINEKLVTAIQNYPTLYDLSRRSSQVHRDNCWKEISASISLPVDFCKVRWKSLRDNFTRRQKLLDSGSAAATRNVWPYYDLMSFLIPFSRFKSTIGNYPSTSNVSQPSITQIPLASQPSFSQISLVSQPSFSQTSLVSQPSFSQTSLASQPSFSQTSLASQPSFSQTSLASQPSFSQTSLGSQTTFSPILCSVRAVTPTENLGLFLDEPVDDPTHSTSPPSKKRGRSILAKKRKREEFWEQMVRQVMDQQCDTSLEASMGLLIGRLLKRIPEPRKTQLFQKMINDLCSETVLPAD
ncbi:hypothetical protein CEXT_104541 [Caerostris extrusa]|uniref:MADF domain-containing protein n=1 Tax=Caerostris extrusa TaxID=172846 RepID=A0AAV4NR45_CAEEX|nr:hypothetical protein CEXT_104541 [Caerostris extrusa]